MENNIFFNEKKFTSLCRCKKFGKTVYNYSHLESTNDQGKIIARDGAPEGTLIISRTQNRGRGRHKRHWISPDGGLWFSIILRPKVKDPNPLPVLFGAVISQIIEQKTKTPCGFHWPNDLFINNRKVGGILMESRYLGDTLDNIIVGTGINTNFSTRNLDGELMVPPTTILDETGNFTDLNEFLGAILLEMENIYEEFCARGSEKIIEKHKKRCITLGRNILVLDKSDEAGSPAVARDLSPDGGLIVNYNEGGVGVLYNAERIILAD